MDLRPFISNPSLWRKHFQDSIHKGHSKKFSSVQGGSGFPSNSVVSISPTKQAEDIAKSEIVEINKSDHPIKRVYKRRKQQTKVQKKKRSRTGKLNQKKKKKNNTARILTHRKKKTKKVK